MSWQKGGPFQTNAQRETMQDITQARTGACPTLPFLCVSSSTQSATTPVSVRRELLVTQWPTRLSPLPNSPLVQHLTSTPSRRKRHKQEMFARHCEQLCPISLFWTSDKNMRSFKKILFIFSEGKGGRKRGRETPMCGIHGSVASLTPPVGEPGPQPRHAPWPGSQLVAFPLAG